MTLGRSLPMAPFRGGAKKTGEKSGKLQRKLWKEKWKTVERKAKVERI